MISARLSRTAFRWQMLAVFSAMSAACPALHGQLNFQFIDEDSPVPSPHSSVSPSLDAQMMAGVNKAAQRWSAAFTNHVTLSIAVKIAALPDGTIASTNWTPDFVSYSAVHSALESHAQTVAARSAIANLPNGPSFEMVTNHTSQDPSASGKTPYLDKNGSANNSTICLTQGDARALSLYASSGGGPDATITFNSTYLNRFDFDPDDGITPGDLDFVGNATHELGHALGFTSGVDTLDFYARGPSLNEDSLPDVSALDLFRYSSLSHSDGAGVIDWSADSRPKYFSIDGGATPFAFFSTGENFGDGGQASHWEQGVTRGVMDPDSDFGEKLSITSADLTALNVIGWNFSSVPEPSTYGLGALTVLAAAAFARRRDRR